MGAYVQKLQVEDRLSAAVVRRICDDNNDGAADAGPVARLIADAEDWFESVAVCVYPDLVALRRDGGTVAQTLVLDCVEALCARRFPRAMNRTWTELWEYTDKQLMRMRRGEIKLPVQGSPNPPANAGGEAYLEGVASSDEQRATFTSGGFGSF